MIMRMHNDIYNDQFIKYNRGHCTLFVSVLEGYELNF